MSVDADDARSVQAVRGAVRGPDPDAPGGAAVPEPPSRTVRALRGVLGAAGLVLLAAGASVLLWHTREGTLPWLAVWLAGAVGAHDAVLVPLVLLVGLGLRRVPARPVVRGALLTGGCLTLLALPPALLAHTRRNPTVLPLDYPRGWLLSLAGTTVAALLVLLVRAVRSARSERSATNGRP